MELPELDPCHICANYFEGLIHVVPPFGVEVMQANSTLMDLL